MSGRIPMFAAAAAALFISMPSGSAPTPTRYRVDTKLERTVDLSALGGPTQNASLHTTGYLSVTLADTTGGRVLHAVLDSMVVDSAGGVPQATLDSLRGRKYHGLLSPNGKLTTLSTDSSDASVQIEGILRDLYPVVQPKSKPGATWVDTTDRTNTVAAGSMSIHTVTTYTAQGAEQFAGKPATKIGATFKSRMSGTQDMQGTPAQVTGTATGTGTYYVGRDGLYLGGTRTQDASLEISGSFAPVSIPITVRQTTTISVVQ